MSDVELLREAAKTMRERADRACAAPWNNRDGYQIAGNGARVATVNLAQGHDSAAHIASWHPAVALAVADWLDAEADLHGAVESASGKIPEGWALRVTSSTLRQAVAVARAYLGRDGR